MDTETSEVIDRISARIDALEESLRAELRGESAAVRDELGDEIRRESSSIREDLRGEIRRESSAIRQELGAEFRDGLAGVRRHAEVLHESLRDDIRILADGFAVISTKLDSLQR